MRAATALLCVTLAACSTGYSQGEMERELAEAKLAYTSRELTIEQIDALRPQVPLPARIAIAPPPGAWSHSWTPAELEILESWEEPLRKAGVASQLLILPEALVRSCSQQSDFCRTEEARLAAVRAHADAILILNFASDTDEYANPASLLYLTIVGMWLVPGTHRDALTIVDGVLLDSRNEYLYAFARGQGESKSVRPLIYADSGTARSESRAEALRAFGKAFIAQASQLRVAQ